MQLQSHLKSITNSQRNHSLAYRLCQVKLLKGIECLNNMLGFYYDTNHDPVAAFDMVHDPAVALETLISLGFERVLTSGCDSSALEGLPLVKRLVDQVRAPRHVKV